MNILLNNIWHFTEIVAEAIGLFLIAAIVIAIVYGTFVWLWKCFLGCVNKEIRTLRRFSSVLSNKMKELSGDTRFTENERDELYRFWLNARFDAR